ncbi:MAG: hypothetical protein ACP5OG_05210 [Candidatus Nanoarchaeia archaeon]
MIDSKEVQNKIVSFINMRGPSLPVQIARELKIESLFASAFLSELAKEKRIKISNLKVGGSPLYFAEGQEAQLENFQKYFNQKENEAYVLLKQNKILKDSLQDPAIRVALRSIKDFAVPFKNNEEVFWRYMTVSEEEATEIFNKKYNKEIKTEEKKEIIQEPKEIKTEQKQEAKKEEKLEQKKEIEISQKGGEKLSVLEEKNQELPKKQEEVLEKVKEELNKVLGIEDIKKESISEHKQKKAKQKEHLQEPVKQTEQINPFQNPLAAQPKPLKIKPKSEFVLNAIEFINKNFKIIEEKEYKPKEYLCIVEVSSELGPINFLTLAKDKKSITETDLSEFLSIAQAIPLPALVLYTGELNKKAKEYENAYFSIIKTKKMLF